MAESVEDGLRMLRVMIGVGVRVSVVNEDTVMPLWAGGVPRSGAGSVEVATTTE